MNLGMTVLYAQCSKKAFIHLLYTYRYERLSVFDALMSESLCQVGQSPQCALTEPYQAGWTLPTVAKGAQYHRSPNSKTALCILRKVAACFAFRE